MEKFLLDHVPTLLLAVLCVALAVGLAIGGLLLVRRSVALSTLERHNDVAGFIIAVIGVLYAVLLAFVVVISWQTFDNATQTASSESEVVVGLYRDASAFGPQTADIRRELRSYAQSVVTREWPAMDKHQHEDLRTDASLDNVWRAYRAFTPQNATQEAFYTDSIRRLNDLQNEREDRLAAASTELPGPLWGVLLAGGVITVGFTYFFGVRNLRAHTLMVAALAAMIGLTLFLILSLDLPFSGDFSIKPTSMQRAVAAMPRYR
ncbi:MAG: DUF4239 domain-containing protein [Acidimicrobiia bacterium]|nr:DUF4239 domain-containing protein [Acidimicrobiia bacterium]